MAYVVVVGAGLAGLACAFHLERAGHEVEVLEAARTAGGRMHRERLGERDADCGRGRFSSADSALRELAEQVGLGERWRVAAEPGGILLPEGRVRAPSGGTGGWLRWPHLPVADRARLPRLVAPLRRHREQLDPARPEAAARLDTAPAEVLRRRVGEGVWRRLVEPLTAAWMQTGAEGAGSAAALLALSRAQAGGAPATLAGGVAALPRALCERLAVRVGWAVSGVEPDALGVRVSYDAPSGERTLRAEAAVLAVPASAALRLCPALGDEERSFLSGVRYARGITVTFELRAGGSGAAPEDLQVSRDVSEELMWVAAEEPGSDAAGNPRPRLSVGLRDEGVAAGWAAPDAALADAALEALARSGLGRPDVDAAYVRRWDPLVPVYPAGALAALAAFRRRARRTPRVAFAGDYLAGPTAEAAARSGVRAARDVAREVELP